MTIRDLRDLIAGLPDDMPVMIGVPCALEGEMFVDPCMEDSDVHEVDMEDTIIDCLCLSPCNHNPKEEFLAENN